MFPNGTLWLVGDADVLLVGSTEPLDGRIAGIAAAMQRPGVAADLAGVGVTGPFSVTSLFVAQGEALEGVGQRRAAADRRSIAHWSSRARAASSAAARDDNAAALRELAASSPKPPAVERGARRGHTRRLARSRVDVAEGRRPSPGLRRPRAVARAANPDDPAALDGVDPRRRVAQSRSAMRSRS